MNKTFVLDTNVILQTPYCLLMFEDNTVVIPEVVLEELDRFKKERSELGANARQAGRMLDGLMKLGSLSEGVRLQNGGTLRIELNFEHVTLPKFWESDKNDNRIIAVCKGLKEQGENVFLVTKDTFARVKADLIGVDTQDFFAEQGPDVDEQYKGRDEAFASKQCIDDFYEKGFMLPEDVYQLDEKSEKRTPAMFENEFFIIHSEENNRQTALCRYDGEKLVKLNFLDANPFGVVARNTGQKFMQEALMTDVGAQPLVIIKGPAGTAKTFYSLAVGLHKLFDSDRAHFRKILVCRPNVKFDEDIGFLPGTEQQKIEPYLRPIVDNLEVLMGMDSNGKFGKEYEIRDKIDELFDRKMITSEAIAYMRGRSIANNWVIIDEAQNLTPRQAKGLITRAGIGTKLILLGDPNQIDHPFLDERTNGLCYAAETMKGTSCCVQITLSEEECERSSLAYEAAKRMGDMHRLR